MQVINSTRLVTNRNICCETVFLLVTLALPELRGGATPGSGSDGYGWVWVRWLGLGQMAMAESWLDGYTRVRFFFKASLLKPPLSAVIYCFFKRKLHQWSLWISAFSYCLGCFGLIRNLADCSDCKPSQQQASANWSVNRLEVCVWFFGGGGYHMV